MFVFIFYFLNSLIKQIMSERTACPKMIIVFIKILNVQLIKIAEEILEGINGNEIKFFLK